MIGTPNIVILDDHTLFREALRDYLASANCGDSVQAVGSIGDATRILHHLRNALVLLDVSLGQESGLAALDKLRAAAGRRTVRILVLSMHNRSSVVRTALDAGADGYITKDSAGPELLAAIEEVAAGKRYIDPAVQTALAESLKSAGSLSPEERYGRLSPREQEVFALLARGERSKEIARTLHIAPKTADVHRYNILHKMGLENSADLVRLAMEIGVI